VHQHGRGRSRVLHHRRDGESRPLDAKQVEPGGADVHGPSRFFFRMQRPLRESSFVSHLFVTVVEYAASIRKRVGCEASAKRSGESFGGDDRATTQKCSGGLGSKKIKIARTPYRDRIGDRRSNSGRARGRRRSA